MAETKKLTYRDLVDISIRTFLGSEYTTFNNPYGDIFRTPMTVSAATILTLEYWNISQMPETVTEYLDESPPRSITHPDNYEELKVRLMTSVLEENPQFGNLMTERLHCPDNSGKIA
jgi:hypothetical protein